ncbi:MAG TPA: alpha/beta fold hydrolase [Burkholderiaceae bacterium]|nr:alpha/beta fold hydrolase [Burkholderiaceae bacterium]
MTQQQLAVDGIKVFIEGEGPQTVVMIHGWPDTHRLWDAQVALLRGSHRCVRFTLPGFDVARPPRPQSLAQMVALFRNIVDRVSPDQPVTLLLHDWGAIFGYQFAAQHRDRVARIIGVDVGDTNSGAYLKSLGFKAKWMIFAYQVWLAIAWLMAWKLGGSFAGLANRMTRRMASAIRCKTDPAQIGWQMNYPYHMQWTGGFRDALQFVPHCPMLYIYGKRKPFMFQSPQWLEKIAGLPGCAVHDFATGHWVMVHKPDAFNRCIAEWLAQR